MNENNGKLVSVKNVAVGVLTGTIVAGIIIWFYSELKVKADISVVQEIKTIQVEYNKDIRDIRDRLVRIETIIKEK